MVVYVVYRQHRVRSTSVRVQVNACDSVVAHSFSDYFIFMPCGIRLDSITPVSVDRHFCFFVRCRSLVRGNLMVRLRRYTLQNGGRSMPMEGIANLLNGARNHNAAQE